MKTHRCEGKRLCEIQDVTSSSYIASLGCSSVVLITVVATLIYCKLKRRVKAKESRARILQEDTRNQEEPFLLRIGKQPWGR